jgi:hypothetical protein
MKTARYVLLASFGLLFEASNRKDIDELITTILKRKNDP